MRWLFFSSIIFFTLGFVLMFGLFRSNSLDLYQSTGPGIDVEEYFTGPIQAWGIVQDWRGRVTARFDADMVGTWEDGVGTLDEVFDFYSGDKQHRTWTLRKTGDGTFLGEAPDVIGKANGGFSGSALNMKYVLDLPVGDSVYQLNFDDWMWKMNDGVLINRAYMKKFGITVAELTVFMKKVSVQ
jgi:hypothetical protein